MIKNMQNAIIGLLLCAFAPLREHFLLHASLAVLLLTAVTGCDLTGQYDKKFQQALGQAKQRSAFDEYVHAAFTDLVDASRQPIGVKLRLPKKFDAESKALSQNLIPGAEGLPGSAYVLIKELDDNAGKKAPCIAAFLPVSKADAKGDVPTQLQKALATNNPNAKWEDVSVPTPSGQSLALKRMRMPMRIPLPDAKGQLAGQNVRLDLYFVDTATHAVLIAWLIPDSQSQKHDLEKAIEASMGTLEIVAPAGGEAAAPKA